MVAKVAKNDVVSLLDNDVTAIVSSSYVDVPLNFSGAIDILWQIKDKNKSQHTIVHMDIEPFMVGFFEKVFLYCQLARRNHRALV